MTTAVVTHVTASFAPPRYDRGNWFVSSRASPEVKDPPKCVCLQVSGHRAEHQSKNGFDDTCKKSEGRRVGKRMVQMFSFSRWRLPLLAIIMIGVELTTFDNSVTVLGWLNPSPSNYFLAASLVGLFIFTVVGATAELAPVGRRYLTAGTVLLLMLQALINLLAEVQYITKTPPLGAVNIALFTSDLVSIHVLTLAYGAGLGMLSLIAWKAFGYILSADRLQRQNAADKPAPRLTDLNLDRPDPIDDLVRSIERGRPGR